MASQKKDDRPKAPKTPSKEELSPNELDKVVGGLKKNSGRVEDPCGGGE